jgi:cell division protein FtsB
MIDQLIGCHAGHLERFLDRKDREMARAQALSHRHHAPQVGGHRLIIRIVLGLIFVLAAASAVAIYFQQEDQFARIAARRAELVREQSIADQRYEDLLSLKNQVDSDTYIEHIAREKLGMVKPNEIIFEDP